MLWSSTPIYTEISICLWRRTDILLSHDDVIKWKHFPRHWPFVRGIHRSPVNSLHKGQWRGALMFSLICARINGWVNNREAGDLRRYPAQCDVTVMLKFNSCQFGRVIFSKIVLAIVKQSVIQKIFWQLYENNSFKSVIHKIFWQLYGQLFQIHLILMSRETLGDNFRVSSLS